MCLRKYIRMKIIKDFMWLVLVALMIAPFAEAVEDVVVTGDGFVISRQDISDLQAFFSKKGFETNEDEYLNGALKLFLFAEEAVNSGLAPKPELPVSGEEKIKKLFYLHELYVKHVMDATPVSEEAIESYFFAYPEKFTTAKSMVDNNGNWVYVMSKADKEVIRNRILASKKVRLVENEYQRLKIKYRVVLQ